MQHGRISTITIDVENNGNITGIDNFNKNINEFLRAPMDYRVPSVAVDTDLINCVGCTGSQHKALTLYPS